MRDPSTYLSCSDGPFISNVSNDKSTIDEILRLTRSSFGPTHCALDKQASSNQIWVYLLPTILCTCQSPLRHVSSVTLLLLSTWEAITVTRYQAFHYFTQYAAVAHRRECFKND